MNPDRLNTDPDQPYAASDQPWSSPSDILANQSVIILPNQLTTALKHIK